MKIGDEYKVNLILPKHFAKLATIDHLKVVTIGPGFDELEAFLRLELKLQSSPLFEMISQDPMLGWFWSDVKTPATLAGFGHLHLSI